MMIYLKIFFLIISIFSSLTVEAQLYQPKEVDSIGYFKTNFKLDSLKEVYAINKDSIWFIRYESMAHNIETIYIISFDSLNICVNACVYNNYHHKPDSVFSTFLSKNNNKALLLINRYFDNYLSEGKINSLNTVMMYVGFARKRYECIRKIDHLFIVDLMELVASEYDDK